MKTPRLFVVLCIAMLTTSCAVGPDYVRPNAPLSEQFKEANSDWKITNPSDQLARGPWWEIFNDAELNKLQNELNSSNQTIKNAYQNYMQARAQVDEARASFMPTLSANAQATRQKTVSGINSTSIPAGGTKSNLNTDHSLIFAASWEPDIWGLVRRQVEASKSSAEASAALLAATQLSAQAALAQYYFQLRGLDAQQELLDATVTANKKLLQLTKNQYASGVVSRADVVQAETQLDAAESLAINNGVLRAQYEHAIAVLIGVPPAEFTLPAATIKVAPPAIPVILPSELLERRPDIAHAERLMQQANAEIGVAVATYFPSLNLAATGGASGTGLGHWFSLPLQVWSYGPQLSQLIYDGGLRSAEVRAARAGYKASVAAYRQTVLEAMQNVEDNIAALRILTAEMQVQTKAVASAKEALSLVVNQYKSGVVAYSSVVTAEISTFTIEQSAINANYQQMVAAVNLITALGGGWEAASIKY